MGVILLLISELKHENGEMPDSDQLRSELTDRAEQLIDDSCLLVVDSKHSFRPIKNSALSTTSPTLHQARLPSSPTPSSSTTATATTSNNNNTNDRPNPFDRHRFDQVLRLPKRDPVQAGHLLETIYEDHPFRSDGTSLQDWISEYRIGYFNPTSSSTTISSNTDQSPTESTSYTPTLIRTPRPFLQTPIAGPSTTRNGTTRRSHLDRAYELVEINQQAVIDAQHGLGIANLSLAQAYSQLVHAQKIKDYLVRQAAEGCKPHYGPWDTHQSP
ncbi:hypothetical protein PSHT_06789 [Puccinia striiformis]|uniref:Uncharacterized protein n=1 Tax=Puccinia striiformis TaxID=27350 RepID=A0A2S4W394_9BASI|nr:hypothetical protein PSHT_06789 [Puccinia striiformis]